MIYKYESYENELVKIEILGVSSEEKSWNGCEKNGYKIRNKK